MKLIIEGSIALQDTKYKIMLHETLDTCNQFTSTEIVNTDRLPFRRPNVQFHNSNIHKCPFSAKSSLPFVKHLGYDKCCNLTTSAKTSWTLTNDTTPGGFGMMRRECI